MNDDHFHFLPSFEICLWRGNSRGKSLFSFQIDNILVEIFHNRLPSEGFIIKQAEKLKSRSKAWLTD